MMNVAFEERHYRDRLEMIIWLVTVIVLYAGTARIVCNIQSY